MARDGFVSKRARRLGRTVALAGVVFDVLDGAALGGNLGESLSEGTFGLSALVADPARGSIQATDLEWAMCSRESR